jgi:hypothetical protein
MGMQPAAQTMFVPQLLLAPWYASSDQLNASTATSDHEIAVSFLGEGAFLPVLDQALCNADKRVTSKA